MIDFTQLNNVRLIYRQSIEFLTIPMIGVFLAVQSWDFLCMYIATVLL